MPQNPGNVAEKIKKYLTSFYGDTIYKKIFRIYVLIVLLGAIILFCPFSLKENKSNYSFFDSLFTAISAFTNTGLTVHDTDKTFSFVGQLIILLLIQAGGMGLLTIFIFIWHFVSRKNKINVEHRILLYFERGGTNQASSLAVVKTGIRTLLIAELIGAFILTLFFYIHPETISDNSLKKNNFLQSIWLGIFHAISGTNNAGFDILQNESLMGYKKDWGNILSATMLVLSFIGGVGYPVFYDIFQWAKNKRKNTYYQIPLFTKISLLMYFCVSFIAIIFIIGIESSKNNFLTKTSADSEWGNNAFGNKVWNLIYLTFSARSAGFTGIKITELNPNTQWLLTILMFIGASPSSTAGGIRSITLFLICSKIFSIILAKKHVNFSKRTISNKTIEEAMIVYICSTILIMFFSLLLPIRSTENKILHSLFECSSAFGTAGLTVSATENTNMFGKILLLILMLIGQLGVSNVLLSWTNSKLYKKNIQYITEEVRII